MNKGRVLIATGLLLSLAGCANSHKYYWGGYERGLYQHYKNPANQEDFTKKLAAIIEAGEQKGNVPPGLYAEYGFMLYTSGNKSEAIPYFEKEKTAWPESGMLMERMIKNAQAFPNKALSKAEDNQVGEVSR